jgi:hypothetical protein
MAFGFGGAGAMQHLQDRRNSSGSANPQAQSGISAQHLILWLDRGLSR